MCSTSSKFNSICHQDFWKFKYTQEFRDAVQTRSDDTPQRQYLKRKTHNLTTEINRLHHQLFQNIQKILLGAVQEKDTENMHKVIKSVINWINSPSNYDFYTTEELVNELIPEQDPTSRMEEFYETLRDRIYDYDISEINGVELTGDDPDAEMQEISAIFKKIITALLYYSIQAESIYSQLDIISNFLTEFPEYKYMEMSPWQQLENQKISMNLSLLPPAPSPEELPTLPTIYPSPPPPAPKLSNLPRPRRLPPNFPLPKQGPAPSGSRIPSDLPPAPPQRFIERGILWWDTKSSMNRKPTRPGIPPYFPI